MSTTLFEKLGGREGISNIVNDTVENHMNNTAVNARFLPYKSEPEKLDKIKKHTIDFFSMGSGGSANYTGRDMETAHKGMNISPGEYMHTIDDIFAALDKNSIDEAAKKEVLYILWSLKGMIIAK
ncbi:group I truncated hemoglobin [Namhaeicola litoreus]|uniref:Group 1 truncated hemoglobin n=1 Tax=Namhaeicola litoreus TaxID=1052145 RepID=A0ABW3Y2X1_9FLAO